jgi:hypothetical protein
MSAKEGTAADKRAQIKIRASTFIRLNPSRRLTLGY